MRIIAGEFRGRRLLSPIGDQTRPITDRVKQSLFDILAPGIPDSHVYDCFAGTGSLGLECLSRGAASAVFVESDRSAVALLRKNIDALGVGSRSTVVAGDAFQWFSSTTNRPASIIFLDPPYAFVRDRNEDLRRLGEQIAAHHLSPDGIVVLRHSSQDGVELGPLLRYDERIYGGMTIEFLRAT
jgi:16S rRNA (guanine(966)-N(2))-methyltransferase RsmD